MHTEHGVTREAGRKTNLKQYHHDENKKRNRIRRHHR
jgi:hypothetical protein